MKASSDKTFCSMQCLREEIYERHRLASKDIICNVVIHCFMMAYAIFGLPQCMMNGAQNLSRPGMAAAETCKSLIKHNQRCVFTSLRCPQVLIANFEVGFWDNCNFPLLQKGILFQSSSGLLMRNFLKIILIREPIAICP